MSLKENYRLHQKDTGSTAVQIILLRKKIKEEKIHLEKNKKRYTSQTSAIEKRCQRKKIFSVFEKVQSKCLRKIKKRVKIIMW